MNRIAQLVKAQVVLMSEVGHGSISVNPEVLSLRKKTSLHCRQNLDSFYGSLVVEIMLWTSWSPKGGRGKNSARGRFVVQKSAQSRLCELFCTPKRPLADFLPLPTIGDSDVSSRELL